MSVVCKKFQKFIKYIKIGNLQKVIEIIESNQVDASAQNNAAIIRAAESGHLEFVKYLSTLPNVDASARNNWAIICAAHFGHLEVVEYLSKLPKVDASAQDNLAIMDASRHRYLPIVAMLLYFEPKVASSLSDKKQYRNLLLHRIRLIVHKITIALVELPTPILIEIIEQAIDFGIYMPYHIKWNMVVAIKHNKNTKYSTDFKN